MGRDSGGTVYHSIKLVTAMLRLNAVPVHVVGEPCDEIAGRHVDNDGIADFIIGADNFDPNQNRTDAGRSYVVFGPLTAESPTVLDIDSLTDRIVVDGGASVDLLGRNVEAGDVNNDGFDDLIVGAGFANVDGMNNAGTAYVFLGPRESSDLEAATDADHTYLGASQGDGLWVGAAVGDINNDGLNDLFLGAWWANPDGRQEAGDVYAILGQTPPPKIPVLSPCAIAVLAVSMAVLFGSMYRRAVGGVNGP